MNNIWKYSLLLAFGVIIDQLAKGSAQSLISVPGGEDYIGLGFSFTRVTNSGLIFGLTVPSLGSYLNSLSVACSSLVIIILIRQIILWRNMRPHFGWALSLILLGVFSSWLDRISHAKTLDYLSLKAGSLFLSFSLADLSLCLGIAYFIFLVLKEKYFEANSL